MCVHAHLCVLCGCVGVRLCACVSTPISPPQGCLSVMSEAPLYNTARVPRTRPGCHTLLGPSAYHQPCYRRVLHISRAGKAYSPKLEANTITAIVPGLKQNKCLTSKQISGEYRCTLSRLGLV